MDVGKRDLIHYVTYASYWVHRPIYLYISLSYLIFNIITERTVMEVGQSWTGVRVRKTGEEFPWLLALGRKINNGAI